MSWKILYRGPLHSCNYACTYCPFAKSTMTRAELQNDFQRLERFVDWVMEQQTPISLLFTPWGEALGHHAYQQAMVRLSHAPHVEKVSIQTNLSCSTSWMADAHPEHFALWTTYHPEQVARARFLAKCRKLDQLGRHYSVGMVGLKPHLDEIAVMRDLLPPQVYLWINAYKREPDYYGAAEIETLTAIDPLFPYNLRAHSSLNRPCRAGDTAFTVDGDGDLRRCHFIKNVLGNIYAPDWQQSLQTRACTNATCGCHIGYVHMPELGLYERFGDGLMERRLQLSMLATGSD